MFVFIKTRDKNIFGFKYLEKMILLSGMIKFKITNNHIKEFKCHSHKYKGREGLDLCRKKDK